MSSNERWENKLILSPACEELFIDNRLQAGLCEYGIQLGGLSALRERYFVRRECCKYHTLIYTRGGCGVLNTPRQTQRITAGSLLLLPAEHSFSYELEPELKQWDIVWYLIDDLPRWQWLKKRGELLCQNYNADIIYHLSMALYQEESARQPLTSLVSLNAGLLVEHFHRDLQLSTSVQMSPNTIDDFFHHLKPKLQQAWNLASLSALAGYSPAHFNRLCLQQLNLTPMKKLRQLRMQRAKLLLHSSDLNLSDIATAVGYRDVFNFSSAFKREEGVAPKIFRDKKEAK